MKKCYKIYGITDCPSCLRALAAIMDLYPSVEHVFINLDFSPSRRRVVRALYEHPTFPIVVEVTPDGEKLIGGYTELLNHISAPVKSGAIEPPVRPYE